MVDFVSIPHAEIERFLKIESLYGFFHQSSFLLINCVRSSGTSLYFSNAPSIKEGEGDFQVMSLRKEKVQTMSSG